MLKKLKVTFEDILDENKEIARKNNSALLSQGYHACELSSLFHSTRFTEAFSFTTRGIKINI